MYSFKNLMSNKKIFLVLITYLLLSFGGCVMILFRAAFTGGISHIYLIWNLFLAWIPLILALVIHYIYVLYNKGVIKSLSLFLLGCVWIINYPNAPYILTDYIHINVIDFYNTHGGYSNAFIVWYDFIMNSLFIFTGFLIGFISLYLLHGLLKDKFNKPVGWLFVVCILFLSSYGIYLGRFIRWNSWDVISNPRSLINSIINSFHGHEFAFTITYGLFLILIYIALYSLTYFNEN